MAKAKSAPAKKPAVTKVVPSTISRNAPVAVFNIEEIQQLLKAVNEAGIGKLKLERGDFKITIKQQGTEVVTIAQPQVQAHTAPSPVAAPAPVAAASSAPASPAAASASADNLITIKSPMIGTFYRSSGPGKPTFVNVGDEIKVGQVLCIVEAMKLFNEIESEYAGKIVKVLIDDASPVEYDQPLFLIEP